MNTTFTSREFNQDVSAAKKAALHGPVTITDHGRPSHVLLSVEDYDKLLGSDRKLGDILWSGQNTEIELEISERSVSRPPVEL
ncbi:type II toxin-antitoxin system Phd/YefM family antitoxin [Glutamicibacter protophormiae]|uniref:Antitoxin n=1 Tax=Glutamicibacter protophormiae TaxID=37930 RepID=A0ABS4XQL3_GLUPR|nr:type II toxin-antitoxin system Phd/YefM family antitoxin [Glutamicibacter protophormiae]MBP2398798.1 prevent-host-death family protein [Glutamicibacter protophormiae]QRQ79500.1 type II toxin-antitoxin system Phd/YefM family antitoxin [Glutamicibacter protophormiae]WPR65619.1 type II toxin-antitoxin system Phd/YefM family antitoxin [Glutamicibacter protophormiae]WPR69117.1 type II toxin-antitoxin system Phd/YefM family antitoxin [Glutamicibacter protophormiae]GGL82537.1 antitoxin [Glutamicib